MGYGPRHYMTYIFNEQIHQMHQHLTNDFHEVVLEQVHHEKYL